MVCLSYLLYLETRIHIQLQPAADDRLSAFMLFRLMSANVRHLEDLLEDPLRLQRDSRQKTYRKYRHISAIRFIRNV